MTDDIVTMISDKPGPKPGAYDRLKNGKEGLVSVAKWGQEDCTHVMVTYYFSESHDGVTCGGCGVALNPIFVLEQLATNESIAMRRYELYKTEREAIKTRRRVKCQHCKKMTKIHVSPTDMLKARRRLRDF